MNIVLLMVGCLEEFDEGGAGYHGEYAEYFHGIDGFYGGAEETKVVDDEATDSAGDKEDDYGHAGAE